MLFYRIFLTSSVPTFKWLLLRSYPYKLNTILAMNVCSLAFLFLQVDYTQHEDKLNNDESIQNFTGGESGNNLSLKPLFYS